jgi:hypothetical protein
MIVNVRGSHGAGKSTVIRAVMQRGIAEPIYGLLGPRLPEAYEVTLPGAAVPTYVIGPYRTPCGGCDQIKHNETVMALVGNYAGRGHVLFEGVLISSAYGAVGTFLERWGRSAVFVFLDTPLEECLRRVEARRGRERDERLIRNVTGKFRSGARVYERIISEGKMRAILSSSQEAPEIIIGEIAP